MFPRVTLVALATLSALSARAAPLRRDAAPNLASLPKVDAVTNLTTSQLDNFIPAINFALTAYCPSDTISNWQCGTPCEANAGFQTTLVGGDGNDIQNFFVGYFPASNSVVVSHQGTDPAALMSDLTDAIILKGPLNATLFPGAPSGLWVHDGFRDEHEKTAPAILAEVQRLIATKGATQVTTIGHSLGGALAELDSLFFSLNLPSNIQVQSTTFGTPRVGNSDFVDFFNSNVKNFQRVNNQDDLVPIVPGEFLGFVHPAGEVHILGENEAVACPGNDNDTDEICQRKTVPTILQGNILNHLGPYQGLHIGGPFCNPPNATGIGAAVNKILGKIL